MKFKKSLYIFIIILIFLFVIVRKSYIPFLPGIPIYPNNFSEIKLVKKYISQRTNDDIEFFYKTNKTVSPAFLIGIEETREDLDLIINAFTPLIYISKYLINRARPAQISPDIIPIDDSTAQTPAYPAGHALQAFYLYKYLSNKYPSKSQQFYDIAINCDITRVKAGLHYPSDGEFSRKIIDFLY